MGALSERAGQVARPVSVTAATAAWVLAVVASGMSGWPYTLILAAGAVLTAMAVGLPLLAERQSRARAATAEQIAENSAAQMQLVLGDALEPLTYLVGQITDLPRRPLSRERPELQGQAKGVVLRAAAEVLGSSRLRSCYFALQEGPTRLDLAGYYGRAETPRTTFTVDTPLGDSALSLLAERKYLFCHDVHTDPPPGWEPGGQEYRTFLAVPVATKDHAFGLLTIDGLQVGDLTEADAAPVRLFALLLAVALNA